jgi:hypothetical protein
MTRFTKLLTAAVLIGGSSTALATPRTLRTGAPACGNTMGKGGYKDDCTAEARAAQREEKAAEESVKAVVEKADTVIQAVRLTLAPLTRLRV